MARMEVSQLQVATPRVPGPVTVDVLAPIDLPAGAPLLLWLHGGNGADGFATSCRPAFERCWTDGSLPPLTVAMPHSGRSFWLDAATADGPQWETFVAEDLVDHLRSTLGVGHTTAVGGVSMGGMGGLRMAFRRPDRLVAVAAMEPGIEPTAEWGEVAARDVVYRQDVLATHYGDPVDPDRYRAQHPLTLARERAHELAAHGLAIYLECGDADGFQLHHGTEALHRVLWELGVRHEYRSVRGADHVGRSLGPRMVDALRFVGRALRAHATRGAESAVRIGIEPGAAPGPDPAAEFLASATADLHQAGGLRRTTTIPGPAGPIEVHEYGTGPPVVLLPSLGRGAADFDDLARRLAMAGYHAIHPEPRGIGGSTGELAGLTMADLAADVAAVIHSVARGRATLVGHAFGNRVARMTATEYPHLVESVVLLACGGLVPAAPEHTEALLRVFDDELSDDDHLAAVRQAFFAPGNDASVWRDGWHGSVAAAQSEATRNQPVAHWWGAGGLDLFVVQPADDVVAVPENAHRICAEFGHRASMITLPRAGHALLPEQPEAVEVAVRAWLTRDRRAGVR